MCELCWWGWQLLGAPGFLSSNRKDASDGAVVVLTDTMLTKQFFFWVWGADPAALVQ